MKQVVDRDGAVRAPDEPTGGRLGLALPALTALMVGSMIGSGIFALPSQMAGSAQRVSGRAVDMIPEEI